MHTYADRAVRACTRVHTYSKAEGKRALHSPRMAAADIQLISFLRDYRFERGGKSRGKRRKRQNRRVASNSRERYGSSPVSRGDRGTKHAIEFACLIRADYVPVIKGIPGNAHATTRDRDAER